MWLWLCTHAARDVERICFAENDVRFVVATPQLHFCYMYCSTSDYCVDPYLPGLCVCASHLLASAFHLTSHRKAKTRLRRVMLIKGFVSCLSRVLKESEDGNRYIKYI